MDNSSNIDKELSAYQAPEAELLDQHNDFESTPFFPVSLTKLTVMYLATLGMYSVVWFYHNWKLQQKNMEKKIRPVWRAIFSIFFTHSLFERIHEKSEERGMENWAHQGLATLFVVFILVGSISDRIFEKVESLSAFAPLAIILSMLPLLSLYQAQKRVNLINEDLEGRLNSNFSAVNIIFIVLGALWWAAIIFGSFIMMTE
tara:strand:- start:19534 stop:20139 length:606 start_codon:yes stop_codon:yes gene_type:complete